MKYRRGHYIPSNADLFGPFVRNIIRYVEAQTTGRSPRWPAIPGERVDVLKEGCALFEAAFKTAVAVPTHANILARQQAQAEATAIVRAFVNQFLRFPPVTDADRVEMGIPNHDNVRTDHSVVSETVEFEINLKNIRELLVDFWVRGADHKAKPPGCDGAVVIWGIASPFRHGPPQSPDELTRHAMASRTPYALRFDETERGKTVWIALAWQNERGILGPLSDYKSAIIP